MEPVTEDRLAELPSVGPLKTTSLGRVALGRERGNRHRREGNRSRNLPASPRGAAKSDLIKNGPTHLGIGSTLRRPAHAGEKWA